MYPGTIEGKWIGYFKYDQGYPLDIQARYISFQIELWSTNSAINGTCIDDHTRHLNIGPATIIGTFEKNIIRFTKTYPCFFTLGESRKVIILPGKSPDIEYYGRLKKKWFSGEYYFKGKARIDVSYLDKLGQEKSHTFWSVWSMKKAL